MRRPAAFAAAALALLAPCGGLRAQTTAEGAGALQAQFQMWLDGLFGADRPLLTAPLTAVANGDHYDVVLPLAGAGNGLRLMGAARDMGGGAWAFEGLRESSPAEYRVTSPQPATADGQPPRLAEIVHHMTVGAETGQALIDTTLQAPSDYLGHAHDVTIASVSDAPSTVHVEHATSSFTVAPTGTRGRMNLTHALSLQGVEMVMVSPSMGAGRITCDDMTLHASADDLSLRRLAEAGHAYDALLVSTMAQPGGKRGTPRPEGWGALLAALIDSASSGMVEQRCDAFSATFGDVTVGMDALTLGFDAEVQNGRDWWKVVVGFDALHLPDLRFGALAELIPSKLTVRSTVWGAPSEAVRAMAGRLESGETPGPADMAALFVRGPIEAGIDGASVEVAGTKFTMHGVLEITGPGEANALGQIKATNFDALRERIAAAPGLGTATAAMIFVKGIGRVEDDRLIWDVVYRDGHVVVNGTDLSAMAGLPPLR